MGPTTPGSQTTTNDPIRSEQLAEKAATRPGFLSTVVPVDMKAQKSYSVTASVVAGEIEIKTSTTTVKNETTIGIPVSTVMSVILEGDHFKITADEGDNTIVGERRTLNFLGSAQTEWAWKVTPQRPHFDPLNNSESLHLFFHVWFFLDKNDTTGVEVTPPRERDLVVEVNPAHSLWESLVTLKNIVGFLGVSVVLGGVAWTFKRRRPKPSPKKKRTKAHR